MNPVLPKQYFIPDVEARVGEDNRLYFYGSMDISGDTLYCSYQYHVFSSADLMDWSDHGVSFRSSGPDTDVPWSDMLLFAPDCIYHKGLYYLYFCQCDAGEGVATSTTPYGPFKNAAPVQGAHGDAIDPAIFVDDDGQVYYYWGQFHLRGAKLNPDMSSIDPDSLVTDLINEQEHGFHEGASIRKRNGIYYMLYTDISRGRATCISYATSLSPLGPFKKGGVIVDNTGCDPETWNNHGSMAEFQGQWYVFYHRSSQGTRYNRRVCMEPIHFNEDGSIDEVEMTTQGASEPIIATNHMDAYRACLLSGKVRTGVRGISENHDYHEEFLTFIHDRDWAAYKYVSFDTDVKAIAFKAASLKDGGEIQVRLDQPDGQLIGACTIGHTGGWENWQTFTCPIEKTSGVHALYLVFKGPWGRLFDLSGFKFL